MPELPDLQVFSRHLQSKLKGKTLEKIIVVQDQQLNVSKAKLKKTLEGSKLTRVYREGKELRFVFSNKHILGLHLMLKGRLGWYDPGADKKHRIAELIFKGGCGFIINDYQKKARLTLDPVEKVSPDALSSSLSFSYLKEKLSRKKTSIKAFLLDQGNLRGIGNAYADEILWEARISPFSTASALPDASIRLLLKKIKTVLTNAEKNILKLEPGLISGEVRSFLKIHNAAKKKSPKGALIRSDMINGRISYFTSEQKKFE